MAVPAVSRYSFPLKMFDFDILYHRWLLSFSQAVNDAQFLSHLWAIYEANESEPQEIHSAEKRWILYHAMAHTYSALSLLFDAQESVRRSIKLEIDGVLDGVEDVQERRSLRRDIKRSQKSWKDKYKRLFSLIRNQMVAHYVTPEGNKFSREEVEPYWNEVKKAVDSAPDNTFWDGTIIIDNANRRGRFHHMFVDVIQESYLDSLVDATFADEITNVAEFLDTTNRVFAGLCVPLLTRVLEERRRPSELNEEQWDGEWQPAHESATS